MAYITTLHPFPRFRVTVRVTGGTAHILADHRWATTCPALTFGHLEYWTGEWKVVGWDRFNRWDHTALTDTEMEITLAVMKELPPPDDVDAAGNVPYLHALIDREQEG